MLLSHVIYDVLDMPPDGPLIRISRLIGLWLIGLGASLISCASLTETLIACITLMTMDTKHTYHIH